MSIKSIIAGFALFSLLSSQAVSVTLFSDQMVNGTGWGVNAGGSGDSAATFNYDYSTDWITEAPNSQVGDASTRGVRLEANMVAGSSEYFTLYPLGQNFSGSYQLRFDAWMNFNTGGTATTEFLGGGIGYDNVTADIASGAQAMATGDGGSSNDWRAFKSTPQFFIPDADMAAETHQNFDPYYANFLSAVAPPAAQGQLGLGTAGSPGFQWITWQFTVDSLLDQVLVDIEKTNGDQLRIVDIDCSDTSDGSNGCPTVGNISLFYADVFSSVSGTQTFGIIDNVIVTDMTQVPEPTTLALMGLGLAGIGVARKRRNRVNS